MNRCRHLGTLNGKLKTSTAAVFVYHCPLHGPCTPSVQLVPGLKNCGGCRDNSAKIIVDPKVIQHIMRGPAGGCRGCGE